MKTECGIVFSWLALVPGAAAQPPASGWLVEVDYGPGHSVLSPVNPTARVTISAYFPREIGAAFAAARWDVVAPESGWSDNRILPPLTLGSDPGVIDGGLVRGIVAGQVHFPPVLPADPSNPIGAWTALWTASDFRPRSIRVVTDTTRFDIYVGIGRTIPIVIPAPAFREGAAKIRVVPAPASLLVMLGLVVPGRRRGR